MESKPAAATGTAPFFQAKLTVNTPGDAHEREADQVADRVMRMQDDDEPVAQRMPLTPVSSPSGGGGVGEAQRMCVECEEKEKEKLQRTETAGSTKSSGHPAPSIVGQVLSSGGGRPLEAGTRQFMENRFGQDFGQVRIHTGGQAAESAAAIQAKAYTSGRNIVFGAGEYRPESIEGRRLLAHELAHVGQQQHRNLGIQRNGFGDVRIAEGYDEALKQIKSSQKFNSLGFDEKKTTAEIILAIEKHTDWPSRYGFMASLNLLFGRIGKKADWDAARAKILSLGLDKTRVTALLDVLSKALQGYVASGFDFSSRFFQHDTTLGFSLENKSLGSYASNPYDRRQPTSVTDPAEESFKKSDILFFSGHQYAQYREPGTFTNDSSDSCFNIGMLSKANKRVKLVVSTSCATICKDIASIWMSKFPDALILGYRYSAPLNGGIVANAFAAAVAKKGPIDLSDSSGLDQLRSAWKAVVLGKGSLEGGPGLLYGGEVEIFSGGKWIKKAWNDPANECHYH